MGLTKPGMSDATDVGVCQDGGEGTDEFSLLPAGTAVADATDVGVGVFQDGGEGTLNPKP